MDGTLLGDDSHVSPRNLAALHAAQAVGIHIVVATGRRHSFAMRVLRPLALHPASVLISSNGTVTRTLGAARAHSSSDAAANAASADAVPSQLLACAHLPRATALWLCGHIRGSGDRDFSNAFVLTFDRTQSDGEDLRGALVVERIDQLNASIGRWMAANEPYIVQVQPIERALDNRSGPPIQAMLCGTIERMARAQAHLLEDPGIALSGHTSESAPHHLTLHRTEYATRDLCILDILPAGCSKGAALLALAHARGIEPAQILAIGDNWNDVSMLEVAGHPVLMDNAPEDLKALARARGWRIGPSNRDDGVAHALESILSIAR